MKSLIDDDEQNVKIMLIQKIRKEIKSKQLEVALAYSGGRALEPLEHFKALNAPYLFWDINNQGINFLNLLKTDKSSYSRISDSMISVYASREKYNGTSRSRAVGFVSQANEVAELLTNQ